MAAGDIKLIQPHYQESRRNKAGIIFCWGPYEVCDVCGANKENAAAGAVMVGGARQ